MWSIHMVECCSDFKRGRLRHRRHHEWSLRTSHCFRGASFRRTGKPDSARTGILSSEVHDQDGGGLQASL